MSTLVGRIPVLEACVDFLLHDLILSPAISTWSGGKNHSKAWYLPWNIAFSHMWFPQIQGNSKHPWRQGPPRRPRPSSRHISLAWSLGSLKAVPARKNWWQRTINLLKIWWNTVDPLYYLSKATSKYYVTTWWSYLLCTIYVLFG